LGGWIFGNSNDSFLSTTGQPMDTRVLPYFEGLTRPGSHAIKTRLGKRLPWAFHIYPKSLLPQTEIRRGQAQHSYSCLAVEACSEPGRANADAHEMASLTSHDGKEALDTF